MFFTVFNQEGRLLRTGEAPPNQVGIQAGEGEFIITEPADVNTQYVPDVLNPEITDRPIMPITIDKTECVSDGVDLITVTGIPVGASLRLDEVSAVAIDDTTQLSFDIPGEFKFSASLFPYIDYEVTLNAT